jgi:ATP/ADP translocase
MIKYLQIQIRELYENPKLLSSFIMCLALSIHYFGYECARTASITLLGSKDIGFESSFALTASTLIGTPTSALTLYLYIKSIKIKGIFITHRICNIICCCILFFITIVYNKLNGTIGRGIVLLFYVFREVYVSLLSSQANSFISSILNDSTSSYLIYIAGFVSVISSLGGCLVQPLVNYSGIWILLVVALISSLISFIFVEVAHNHASKYKETNHVNQWNNNNDNDKLNDGFWKSSYNLLTNHNTLRLLLLEAVAHQFCSSMLNLMFFEGLRIDLSIDNGRAIVIGNFFAIINIVACLLQCLILPKLLNQESLSKVLIITPMIVFIFSFISSLNPSLNTTMFAFGSIKIFDYSVLSATSQLIYMPMGKEERYIGKEIIKFLGFRCGKTFSSLVISQLILFFNPSFQTQSVIGTIFSFLWCLILYVVAGHISKNDLYIESLSKYKKKILLFDNDICDDNNNKIKKNK